MLLSGKLVSECMEIKQTTPTVVVSLLQTLMLAFVARKRKTF